MPEVLHLAHLVEHDRVPDVDVRRGRVEAELDPQWLASRELLRHFALDQQFVGAALEDGELVGDIHGHDDCFRKGRALPHGLLILRRYRWQSDRPVPALLESPEFTRRAHRWQQTNLEF